MLDRRLLQGVRSAPQPVFANKLPVGPGTAVVVVLVMPSRAWSAAGQVVMGQGWGWHSSMSSQTCEEVGHFGVHGSASRVHWYALVSPRLDRRQGIWC